MADLSQDPLVNVVQQGIKGDLRVALENGCWRAAVILTFSGMDTMAYLGMPPAKVEVEAADFIEWADRYVALDAPVQPTGVDYYGARCGMVHTYGSESRRSRKGECRQIFYKYRRPGPSVHFIPEPSDPELEGGCFVVSIEALTEAFFRGVDRFLVDLFSDRVRAATAETRFRRMYHLIPAPRIPKP